MKNLALFVANIKSALKSKKKETITNNTKINQNVAKTLLDLGYIYGFTILNNKKIKIFLKFNKNKSVIRYLNLIYKPSSKVYFKKKNLIGKNILSYRKINAFKLLTTSRSKLILTDIECMMLNTGGVPLILVG